MLYTLCKLIYTLNAGNDFVMRYDEQNQQIPQSYHQCCVHDN